MCSMFQYISSAVLRHADRFLTSTFYHAEAVLDCKDYVHAIAAGNSLMLVANLG